MPAAPLLLLRFTGQSFSPAVLGATIGEFCARAAGHQGLSLSGDTGGERVANTTCGLSSQCFDWFGPCEPRDTSLRELGRRRAGLGCTSVQPIGGSREDSCSPPPPLRLFSGPHENVLVPVFSARVPHRAWTAGRHHAPLPTSPHSPYPQPFFTRSLYDHYSSAKATSIIVLYLLSPKPLVQSAERNSWLLLCGVAWRGVT